MLIFQTALPRAIVLIAAVTMLAACNTDGKERVSDFNLSAAALNDYQGTYRTDGNNKAFAISPDGAYAAAHSFPNSGLATAAALLNCNARVQPGHLECLIFDVNGVVVGKPPVRLRRF